MCEPTTLTAMGMSAATASTVSTVAWVAGAALTANAAYQNAQAGKNQAQYAAATADNNAKLAEMQAQDIRSRGDEEANAIRRNNDMLKGSQRASMAAKGLDLAEGTAQELQDQTDFFSAYDQDTARRNAGKDAWRVRQQGSQFSSDAEMNRSMADQYSPLMAAGTSLLGSANRGGVNARWIDQRGAR